MSSKVDMSLLGKTQIKSQMELTTSLKCSKEHETNARMISTKLGCQYVPRKQAVFKVPTYVLEKDSLVLYSEERRKKLFFHPSLAKPRIKQHELYKNDSFLKALDLRPGDQVLDCTLGLATDALLASFAVGESGNITGLESEKGIVEILQLGMKNYPKDHLIDWKSLFARIKIVHFNYKDYLRSQADNSFDVVYLDPMFENRIGESFPIAPLREWANHQEPNIEDITEALRVSKRRLVMKAHKEDLILSELGFTSITSQKTISFGIIEVNY